MPDIVANVHGLTGACHEGTQPRGVTLVVFGHQDQIGHTIDWDERLASQGMPFDHLKGKGRRFAPRVKQADHCPTTAEIRFGKVMKPPAAILVDHHIRRFVRAFDHIPEGLEAALRQWLRDKIIYRT